AAADGKAPVGRPAPAPAAYRAMLEEVFRAHARAATPAAVDAFVDAQTVWDRAMAEALHAARQPGRIAIGIMGRGHVEGGHGVAHQLRALGEDRIWSALPAPPCEGADAFFGTPATKPAADGG
ncbi:MAG: ChaN family lipoprotein, partial [Sphingomonadaceae bacterium]